MLAKDNQDIHRRRSVRLKEYDYAQAGAYFVTICTHNRVCLFGRIELDTLALNEYGQLVVDEWIKTAAIRPEVALGEYVVMPNHFHGIIKITHGRGTACRALTAACRTPNTPLPAQTIEKFGAPIPGSLPTIIRSFKSAVTKSINEIRQSAGASLWQRNYYEHVIRDESDYSRIVEYMADNPRRWAEDSLHPDNVGARRSVPGVRETSGVPRARHAVPLRTITGRGDE